MLNTWFFSYIHRHSCHRLFYLKIILCSCMLSAYLSFCGYSDPWFTLSTNELYRVLDLRYRYFDTLQQFLRDMFGCLLFDVIYLSETYLSNFIFQLGLSGNFVYLLKLHRCLRWSYLQILNFGSKLKMIFEQMCSLGALMYIHVPWSC